MYIRIEFDNVDSANTKETQELLFSSSNGTFLASTHAYMISFKEMRDLVGYSVVFWHLDVYILNKYYCGVMDCLNQLVKYPGVKRVDILPVDEYYARFTGKDDNLCTILMKYIDGA
jgi:hypothetical protein